MLSNDVFNDVLALIPARGGSKSVPRKNIIKLNGKPMIAWAIESALASKYISRVIVTTDDDEIASIARVYGAEVPFMRPDSISGDTSTDVEFHRHALEWLRVNEGYEPDMVVNLRPTPPSRRPEIIDGAIVEFFNSPNADSLRSVNLAEQTPFKMWTLSSRGYLSSVADIPGVKEPYNEPRQSLPLVYWQNGYVDITRPSVIIEKNSTTGDNILPYIIEDPVTDIDYPESIGLAEAELKRSDGNVAECESSSKLIRYPS